MESLLSKNKVIFAEQYFYPEKWAGAQLSRDIVIMLSKNNWNVNVICGTQQYVSGKDNGEDPRKHGIKLTKIKTFNQNRFILLRILNLIMFPSLFFMKFLFMKHKPNLILIQTNPPTLILSAALISKIFSIPLVIIAMDIYPEILIKKNNNLFFYFVKKIFDYSYAQAEKIIALGPTMKKILLEKVKYKSSVDIIFNWAVGTNKVIRGDKNYLMNELDCKENLNLIYSGNLGQAHDEVTLMKGFELAFLKSSKLKLIFFARGSGIHYVKNFAEKKKFKNNIIIKDLVDNEILPYSMGLASFGIVSIKKDCLGYVLPSKLAGYLSRGIPVIYIGPKSDICDLIMEYKAGLVVRNNDINNFANTILKTSFNPELLKIYRLGALTLYDSLMNKSIGLKKYSQIISKYKA